MYRQPGALVAALLGILATASAITSDLVWEGDSRDRSFAIASIADRLFLLEASNGTSQVVVLEAGHEKDGRYTRTSTLTAPLDSEELCANADRSHLILLDRANSTIWLQDLQAGGGSVLAVGPTYAGPDQQQQHILHEQPVHIACHEDERTCSVFVTTAKTLLRLEYPCLSAATRVSGIQGSKSKEQSRAEPPRRALKQDSLAPEAAASESSAHFREASAGTTGGLAPHAAGSASKEGGLSAAVASDAMVLGAVGLASRIAWSVPHAGHAIWAVAVDGKLYLMLSSEGPDTEVAVYDTGSEAAGEQSRLTVPGKSQMMCAFPSSQRLAFVDRANASIWVQDLTAGKGAIVACQPGISSCKDEVLPKQPGDIACQEGADNECVLFVSEPSSRSLRKLTFLCSESSAAKSSWWESWWVGVVAAIAASVGIAVGAHVFRTMVVRTEAGLQELRDAQAGTSAAALRGAGYQGVPGEDPLAIDATEMADPVSKGYTALPKGLSALTETDSLSGTPLLRNQAGRD